jgi:hypothetical protein
MRAAVSSMQQYARRRIAPRFDLHRPYPASSSAPRGRVACSTGHVFRACDVLRRACAHGGPVGLEAETERQPEHGVELVAGSGSDLMRRRARSRP